MKYTKDVFITKAKQVHGDRYDYSLVEYMGSRTKVDILCSIHGLFTQEPSSHLRGNGCPECGNSKKYTKDAFITKAKQVHGDRYDYSLVEYINSHTKVKILCLEHGRFEQKPYSHLQGIGCKLCGVVSSYTTQRSNTETFITKAKQVHNDSYDYSLVEYINSHTKVKILCLEHGPFEQIPNNHLNGARCPKCSILVSKQELELLDFISTIYKDEIITNTRSIITPYELDIYLPKTKLAFEYNGEFWHEEGVRKPFGYHNMKTKRCEKKGVKLYHIWERDWMGDNNNTKDMIRGLLLSIDKQ
jgi:hypothetical protein